MIVVKSMLHRGYCFSARYSLLWYEFSTTLSSRLMWVLPNNYPHFSQESSSVKVDAKRILQAGLFHRDKTRKLWEKFITPNMPWMKYIVGHLVEDNEAMTQKISGSLTATPPSPYAAEGYSLLSKFENKTLRGGRIKRAIEVLKDSIYVNRSASEREELLGRRCRAYMFMIYKSQGDLLLDPLAVSFDLEIDLKAFRNNPRKWPSAPSADTFYAPFDNRQVSSDLKTLEEVRGFEKTSWRTPVAHIGRSQREAQSRRKLGHFTLVDDVFEEDWSYPKKDYCLNPRWVECLMGVPIGTTQPSATELTNVLCATQHCTNEMKSWIKTFLKKMPKPVEGCD